jgi:hypothetical protein
MPKISIRQTEFEIKGSMREVVNLTRMIMKPYGQSGRNHDVSMWWIS